MTTTLEKKQIKRERALMHKWLLSTENLQKVIASHCGGIAEKFNKQIESPLKNLSCNCRIWYKYKKEDSSIIIVKFKYSYGDEDFIDAMRSLKRQMKLEHESNEQIDRRYANRVNVEGTILTVDRDTSDDPIISAAGITIIRIKGGEEFCPA